MRVARGLTALIEWGDTCAALIKKDKAGLLPTVADEYQRAMQRSAMLLCTGGLAVLFAVATAVKIKGTKK